MGNTSLFASHAAVQSQAILQFDVTRNRLSENHRSALESLGEAIRRAGAGLPPFIPAAISGNSGSPEISLRSSYLPEVGSLTLCNDIVAGSNVAPLIAGDPMLSSCPQPSDLAGITAIIEGHLHNTSQNVLLAFILNRGTNVREFFDFKGFTNSGSTLRMTRSSSEGWSNAYPAGTSSIFFISETRFRVTKGYLEVLKDGDATSPQRIAGGIDAFRISKDLVNPNTTGVSQFAATGDWTRIRAIAIEVEGSAPSARPGLPSRRTTQSSFYIRNVASKL